VTQPKSFNWNSSRPGRQNREVAIRAADKRKDVREGTPKRGIRYSARVEYDGTDFAGFQAQSGARTVQGELEAALARLNGGVRLRVDGAGRTDAGVHATDQVIAFSYPGRLSADDLGRAFDALLPADLAVRNVRPAVARFHPRHAARYREYRYTVWNGPRSPIRERFALGVRVPLNVAAMAEAASALAGRHDFTAFGAATGLSPIRTVHRIRVARNGREVTIDIAADAFLRGMARRIVAVLLEVGRGTIEKKSVALALAHRRPALDGATAPPKGVRLRRVVLGRRFGPRDNEQDEAQDGQHDEEEHGEQDER
jgi:tRNA pseudouridine38-40 synthase